MRLAITGAAGFVGRAVVRHLTSTRPDVELLLADRHFDAPQRHDTLTGDLTDPAVLRQLCADATDAVLHLAALPGGAAERDPVASRMANLDVPVALIEAMRGRRLVIAGSIAVFGATLPADVDDETVPKPASVYGTHKRMVELALADAVRRGALGGMVLRLPGIVARPAAAGGFGSAFMSDTFHAARSGLAYSVPVAPDATVWLMSAQACAANLAVAALGQASEPDAVTLPALRVGMDELVAELAHHGDVRGISFVEDAATRRTFGSYPPLSTPRAETLGFRHDGTLRQLVAAALAAIEG
jgi:nucleoside-diphosphate-sugar epimerase